jgi:hypothetical protein
MYDTGFTGVKLLDRRLKAHYDFGSLTPDSFRRSYDHYSLGTAYDDAWRRAPHCGCKGHGHPTLLATKTRYWVEQNCPAVYHYTKLLDGVSYASTPEVAVASQRVWDGFESPREVFLVNARPCTDPESIPFPAVDAEGRSLRPSRHLFRDVPATDKYAEEVEAYERSLLDESLQESFLFAESNPAESWVEAQVKLACNRVVDWFEQELSKPNRRRFLVTVGWDPTVERPPAPGFDKPQYGAPIRVDDPELWIERRLSEIKSELPFVKGWVNPTSPPRRKPPAPVVRWERRSTPTRPPKVESVA